jgi:hypothetical protein
MKTQINPKSGIVRIDQPVKFRYGHSAKAITSARMQLISTAADPSRLRSALTEVSEDTMDLILAQLHVTKKAQ